MPRAIWSGTISFGLVNVAVKAFTAVRPHDIHFHQLEKKTGARIRNQKVSETTGKAVEGTDIEMGFEIRKGRYVTFEKGETDELRPASTRSIDVSDFVALDDIDPIYYERTHWLAPGEGADDPYRLLVAAMEDRGLVGIGTVVMRSKQYLAAIRPLDGALAMSTMRFADEVIPRSDIDDLPSGRAKPDPKALKLAEQIVDSLTTDWDPKRYHDDYTEELLVIIERKDKGKADLVESDEGEAEKEAEVLDLMTALERSVSEAKSKRAGGTSRRRRAQAPTRRKAAPAKKRAAKRASA